MKKILFAFGVFTAVVLGASMFAAFEAHVINVTAKIENALAVPLESIDFGTVFPQEHLNKPLGISLSQSFVDEGRVDDVDYIIRQKPKCAITSQDGTVMDKSSPALSKTGHVIVDPSAPEGYRIDCGDAPRPLLSGETWGVLPMLCPYISKEPDNQPENDGSLASFHEPFEITPGGINWNDTLGHLAKSQNDIVDNWTIDLSVPCFGGFCAQDWAQFVADNDGDNNANAADYTQPIENEHKVFGCDLWVEVGGISIPGFACQGKIDLMLVVDESGSIGPTNMANVRTALHSFIDALILATDGPNAGQTSFATIGVLDQQLTDSPAAMHAAIDTLVSGGTTNLSGGIALANDEFNSGRDRADAANIMLVVTDGQPNACYIPGCGNPAIEAASYASAGKADGTEIYVVGVGSGVNATYLTNDIASPEPPTHYFAGDFGTLQTTLVDLVSCE